MFKLVSMIGSNQILEGLRAILEKKQLYIQLLTLPPFKPI